MYREAAVISALMKVYSIPCHDRGHINGMLVLQSCTFPTSSDGACNFSNIKVEEDVVVIEEGFIAINEEVGVPIQEEESPENINFPDIKSEPDKVSYVCRMSLIRHIFPVFSDISCFCRAIISGQTQPLLCWE
jgi:hypothetical protein